jgi:DNA invertase Pin-like site-specific DNA recombinase
MAKTWAYARVSAKDQNLDRQVALLKQYVDEAFILSDKASGKNFERPKWELLNNVLDQGDTLIICSLDRLGRNYKQIRDVWKDLFDRKVNVKILDCELLSTNHEDYETDSMKLLMTNVAFEMFAYIAENERTQIKQRQAEGILVAKSAGKHLGRPKATFPSNWKEVYIRWKRKEISQNRACIELGISKNTFKKLKDIYQKSNAPHSISVK